MDGNATLRDMIAQGKREEERLRHTLEDALATS